MVKVVGALLIIFVGFIVGRLAGLAVKRVLHELNIDKNLRKATGYRVSFERFLASVTSFLIYAASIIMALNHIGLTTVVLTVIASAIVIMLVVSFLLAVRDFLPNAFAGLSLKYKGKLVEGAIVSVKGVEGVVEEVTLLSTSIKKNDETLIIPNAVFQREGFKVKNRQRKSLKRGKN